MFDYNDNLMSDSNTFADGTHKYLELCNSVKNINYANSNSINEVLYRAADLGRACNQMSYQQGTAFKLAGAMASVALLFRLI